MFQGDRVSFQVAKGPLNRNFIFFKQSDIVELEKLNIFYSLPR